MRYICPQIIIVISFLLSIQSSQAFASTDGGLNPVVEKKVDIEGALLVEVSGNYAYVVGATNLYVIDVGLPSSAKVVQTIPVKLFGHPKRDLDAELFGDYFYVSNGGLYIVNVRYPEVAYLASTAYPVWDPTSPFKDNNYIAHAAIYGSFAYVYNNNFFLLFDISSELDPRFIPSGEKKGDFWEINGGNPLMEVSGNYLYVTDYVDNYSVLKIYDITQPKSPRFVKEVKLTNEKFAGHTDLRIYGGKAFITRFSVGLQIVDVSNPSSAKLIKNVSPQNEKDDHECIDVFGKYAFIGTDDGNLEIYDVSQPGIEVPLVGSIVLPLGVTDVAANNDFAYVVSPSGGLTIIRLK